MKRLSPQCARTDMECKACIYAECGCPCHLTKTLPKGWKERRYFSEQRGSEWVVFDRGPDSKRGVEPVVMAVCQFRGDAYNIQKALNHTKGLR